MALGSGLQVTEILNGALLGFRAAILPLRLMSIGYRKAQAPLRRGKTMSVPYYPAETTASEDFSSSYDFTNGVPDASTKDITVNKRKYQPLTITSEEFDRYNFDPEMLGRQKGAKLGLDVVADVLSLVTLANYGAAAFTGLAAAFDSDDVADIQETCDTANMPKDGRSLVIKNTYNTPLLKDADIKPAYAYGDSDPIKEGMVPRLFGFDVVPDTSIPGNGENLVGFAAYRSAIVVGFAPVTPAPSVREQLTDYQVVQDPESGVLIEYRQWGDPDSDSHREVIECNYGYAVGEAAALKRLVSA